MKHRDAFDRLKSLSDMLRDELADVGFPVVVLVWDPFARRLVPETLWLDEQPGQ